MFASKGAVTYSVQISPATQGGYAVRFPALPECEAHGATYEQALANAQRELLSYIETHVQIGIPFVEETLNASSALSITIKLPIISSIEASREFDITNDYVTMLCRMKKIRGFQIGRVWFVNKESLRLYLEKTRAELSRKQCEMGKQIREELLRHKNGECDAQETAPVQEQ